MVAAERATSHPRCCTAPTLIVPRWLVSARGCGFRDAAAGVLRLEGDIRDANGMSHLAE